MDHEVLLALIAIGPQLLLLVAVVLLLTRYRDTISQLVGNRVTSVSVFGFKVDLQPDQVDGAIKARAQTTPDSTEPKPTRAGTSDQLVARANRLVDHLHGRTILWADDIPSNNRIERRMLRSMGMFVETVTTNAEALEVLEDPAETISLVISDVGRESGPSGLDLAADIEKLPHAPYVILYVGRVDLERPLPPGAFGIADRPDDLLNLVMDAIDRID